jgi:hypothetical protein
MQWHIIPHYRPTIVFHGHPFLHVRNHNYKLVYIITANFCSTWGSWKLRYLASFTLNEKYTVDGPHPLSVHAKFNQPEAGAKARIGLVSFGCCVCTTFCFSLILPKIESEIHVFSHSIEWRGFAAVVFACPVSSRTTRGTFESTLPVREHFLFSKVAVLD